MTDHTPTAHARLSPSGAKGWFACPGRLKMEEPYPDTANEYSDEGTACHDVAAWCLTEHRRAQKRVGEWILVSHPDEPVRKVYFTEDMADLVQQYVDYTRASAIGYRLDVEQRLSYGKFIGEQNAFGTTDARIVALDQGEVQIIDAKFGRRPVNVVRNKQLMIYALGSLGDLFEEAMEAERLAERLAAKVSDDDLV